ncbi:MAG: histidine kinase dimerization/phospho-acceptor domain-containing protein [Nocardioidaceae bacterium]
MLDRLEASSERQGRLVVDVAHELQSPLTAFRTQLEVALAESGATDWPEVARELLRGNQEMESLVRDLLFMARMGGDAVSAADGIARSGRHRAGGGGPGSGRPHGSGIQAERVSAAPLRGNREELRRMTRNVVENAVRHASTLVEVELNGSGRHSAGDTRRWRRGPRIGARACLRPVLSGVTLLEGATTIRWGLDSPSSSRSSSDMEAQCTWEAAHPGARFVIWLPVRDPTSAPPTGGAHHLRC